MSRFVARSNSVAQQATRVAVVLPHDADAFSSGVMRDVTETIWQYTGGVSVFIFNRVSRVRLIGRGSE
jgi:hypothetical protein